ncbi:hypothetical protein GW17_00058649 [Ensete ventricosum]|nr:hypothetical protein GW17_00058649 [Ensete ventricosum]
MVALPTGRGATTCILSAYRGSRLWPGHFRDDRLLPGPPTRGDQVATGVGSCPRPARKGPSHAGAAAHKWAADCRCDAYRGGTYGGAPFWDGASLQGRRLWAQRPQELPPEGQRCPSAH